MTTKPTYEELELEVYKQEDVIENLQEQLETALTRIKELEREVESHIEQQAGSSY